MKKIVNIVNFVRACGLKGQQFDLVEPVREEIALNKKHKLPNTFLLQYDALIDSTYQEIFKREQDENMEIGIWFECVRQLVEACGLKWRGAEDETWDWHIIPGFLMAYTQDERRAMVDEFMSKFKEIFGVYPKTVGSWLLDSWSVVYMQEKYDVKAFLMCREQFGIDAYTVRGGYYNQGYYPSKNNIMCPAQTEENKVQVPIFKMLGSDPIYCYNEEEFQTGTEFGCSTMEPVWRTGYTDYIFKSYIDSYYGEECMDFAYATIGQENSFGWKDISKGLPMQLEMVAELWNSGKITVEKVCETGEWFKNTFTRNSTVSLISHNDWANNGLKSVWFACENYRVNLFSDNGKLYFRDINKFDERYQERYLVTPCETMTAFYDNLPVVDGRLWNADGIKSGLKFTEKVGDIKTERVGDSLVCTAMSDFGEIKIELACDSIKITKPKEVGLYFERGTDFGTTLAVSSDSVSFSHMGFDYKIAFSTPVTETEKGYCLNDAEFVEIFMNIR